jgi:hypothetical protein
VVLLLRYVLVTRESVAIDFLVSDIASYRNLRLLTTTPKGIIALFRQNADNISQVSDVRTDQYGIRVMLSVTGTQKNTPKRRLPGSAAMAALLLFS